MNINDYVAAKSPKAIQEGINLLRDTITERLGGDNVPKAPVGGRLRVALGIPNGTETNEQRETLDKLLRLASWGGYESPPEEGELAGIVPPIRWSTMVNVSRVLDKNPPKLGMLAKTAARALVRENLAPEFLEEHGGIETYAISAVLADLFPNVKDDPDTPKTDKEAYLRRMLDEMMQILGA